MEHLYNLGAHTLEVLDEGSILIVAHNVSDEHPQEVSQLDQEETYKLLVVLQALFKERCQVDEFPNSSTWQGIR